MAFASFTRFRTGLVLLLLLVSFGRAAAHDVGGPIGHAWIAVPPAGASTAAGYFTLTNSSSRPMRLVGASSAAAQRVEIHEMSMDGGVMRMRPVSGIDIAPGATIELKPGGMHLMLIGLSKPLQAGETVPVRLVFAGGQTIDGEFHVEARAGHGAHDQP